jgi:tetratricopeptide (TPR) repeat protein
VAYDLKKVFNLERNYIKAHHELYSESLSIPADTFLTTPAYRNFIDYRLKTKQLREFMDQRESLPAGFGPAYVNSNPALFLTYVQLGEYYHEMKAFSEAYSCYNTALLQQLPGLDEENRIRKILKELQKKIRHDDSRN